MKELFDGKALMVGLEKVDEKVLDSHPNLQVIGWGTLRDDIVLFTTSETGTNPTNSVGQVWKIKYDELTGKPANISESTLHMPL